MQIFALALMLSRNDLSSKVFIDFAITATRYFYGDLI